LLGDDVGAVGATEGDAEVLEGGLHGDGHCAASVKSGTCDAELFVDGGLVFHG